MKTERESDQLQLNVAVKCHNNMSNKRKVHSWRVTSKHSEHVLKSVGINRCSVDAVVELQGTLPYVPGVACAMFLLIVVEFTYWNLVRKQILYCRIFFLSCCWWSYCGELQSYLRFLFSSCCVVTDRMASNYALPCCFVCVLHLLPNCIHYLSRSEILVLSVASSSHW